MKRPALLSWALRRMAAACASSGCGGGSFCATSPVTRALMAAFLLKIEHGSGS